MKQAGLLLLATSLFVIVVGVYVWRHADSLPRAGVGGVDFVLQSAQGEVRLTDWHGSIVVMSFGFTHCPDICPMGLTTFAQALQQLDEQQQNQIQGVFISVDPARDTPEHLQAYTSFFTPRLLGITGRYEDLQAVANLAGAVFRTPGLGPIQATPEQHYSVDHSTSFYLLDRAGKLRGNLPAHISSGDLAKRLRAELERS